MKLIIIVVLLFASSHSALGKTWEFCELTLLLLNRHHFSEAELPDWMCLIKHESSYNQAAINRINTDGSWDWGLFQINDEYWCHGNHQGKSNGCGIDCRVFTEGDGDLSRSVACVRKIFSRHNFEGWMAWIAHCEDRDLSSYRKKIRSCLDRSDL